jgi:hypothetical protein
MRLDGARDDHDPKREPGDILLILEMAVDRDERTGVPLRISGSL